MHIAVIGVGASLRGDDAAGLHAVERWQAEHPDTAARPEISIQALELPGLALLDALDGCQKAVIVDALDAGAAPGHIFHLHEGDLAAFEPGSGSAHGWGAAETLQLGRQVGSGDLPQEIVILAIQGGTFETGVGLSAAVSENMHALVGAIQAVITAWIG